MPVMAMESTPRFMLLVLLSSSFHPNLSCSAISRSVLNSGVREIESFFYVPMS